MSYDDIYLSAAEKMEKAVAVFTDELKGIRTGRATPGLVDHIRVDYYGSPSPLKQIAAISVPDPTLILIKPYDMSILKEIEKALQKSDLGINPVSDGKLIRLAIPPLTEERRKELVKVVRKLAEDGRVAVRNLRRDANERLKALEKEKKISEDGLRKGLDEIQNLTNRIVKELDDLLAKKEKEILEF